MKKALAQARLWVLVFGFANLLVGRAAVTNLSANYDSETAGYPPAGWDIGAGNGYGLVSSAAYMSSPNSFLVANTNAGNSQYAVKSLSPAIASNYSGAVEAVFSIMMSQTNSLLLISMNNEADEIVAGVCFNGAGAIQAYGQAGYITIATNYLAGCWYDVEVKYIPSANTFNVNVGRGSGSSGVRVGGLSCVSVARSNSASACFSIRNYGLHDGAGNPLPGTALAYFDNIVVRQTGNMALNKPYTWNYAPDYYLCTESNDIRQLTDGEYTRGKRLWSQPTTVGWSAGAGAHPLPIKLTVDLGSDQPIGGAMFSTVGGGLSGVYFPRNIMVLSSADNTNYHLLTDLLYADTGVVSTNSYTVYNFRADSLRAHGRYVQFVVYGGETVLPLSYTFIFTDELEVYKGEDSWVNDPIPGPRVLSSTDLGVQRRLYYDLTKARQAVATNAFIGEPQRTQLLAGLANAETGFTNFTPVTTAGVYRAILPLTPIQGQTPSHAGILGVYGALAQAEGKPALAAWVAPCLDPLTVTQQPPASPVTNLFVAAMKGESQPGVINIVNSTTSSVTALVSVSGLPGGANPSWIGVNNVEWVDTMWRIYTEEYRAAASALTPLSLQGGGYPIAIPAGMVRQVWLDIKPATNLTAGTYAGNLTITPSTGSVIQVPIGLKVFGRTFPETPALNVSGWDYTDAEWTGPGNTCYDMTPANMTQLISTVYSKFVRGTWGVYTLPYGTYDASGNMTTQPSTNKFAGWRARWPAGMNYRVNMNVGDSIGGLQRGTPAFTNAVKNWVTFWANHLASNGIAPSRLCILLVDEPSNTNMTGKIMDWAAPIQEANTGIRVWEEPSWADPNQVPSGFWPVCNVLCLYRGYFIAGGQSFEDFYRNQQAQGRSLEFYNTKGTHNLDPYSYYRLQAWDCFYMGARVSSYWSFICGGGGNSWNEYAGTYGSASPLYLASNSVNTAKGMEAIRLSVQDYEYLYQLSNCIAQMTVANPNHPSLPAARALLSNACVTVLGATNADGMFWYDTGAKDRALADTVRIEIGEMLDLISPLVLLEDGFEADFGNWTDGGATDWTQGTEEVYSGSYSARAGSTVNNLISDNLDTTGKGTIRIEFWYFDDDIDDSDDVCLQLYNGSSYSNRVELGITEPEDTWHKCDITITNRGTDVQYFIDNFRLKFEGSPIDYGEHLWIDDVKVTAE